jgi:phospholipase/carboxylesterase
MVTGGAILSVAFGPGCRLADALQSGDGRLTARPRTGVRTSNPPRLLGLDAKRDAILQLPAQHTDAPLPLVVLFHGAGGRAEGVLGRLGTAPEEAGVAVLVPTAREATWDAIRFGFGRDVAFVNRALERVFESVAVDPARVTAAGFSDGATYALSLGLVNGDLFRRIVAFSPGFLVEGEAQGKPRIYISHGTADEILPIDRCSRVLVPALRKRGYDVTFREFDGGHEVPPAIAREGVQWAAATS